MIIRLFEPADAVAIRRICVENGRLPEPARPDDELFADYWTRYYTRFEPRHIWVAEHEGVVEGYLAAAADTRKFRRIMKFIILPGLLLRVTLAGALRHPASRMFLLKRIAIWANPEPDPQELLTHYPAHLHVNLTAGARGRGAGSALLGAFVEAAVREGIPGIHVETSEANTGGRRFFEKAGFREIGLRFPFRKVDPALADRAVLVLARELA